MPASGSKRTIFLVKTSLVLTRSPDCYTSKKVNYIVEDKLVKIIVVNSCCPCRKLEDLMLGLGW